MTMELLLFLGVGLLAITAAVAMLVSKNAVHSALFLIVNFFCVAFLYLMLNASFLTMIQIAVYTGAIMVLFLFVIMLLGAEKLGEPTREFWWLAPVSVGLGLAFMLLIYGAVSSGKIDLQGPAPQPPALRVVNAMADAGPVDVYANDQLLAQNVGFGSTTEFETLAAGDYTISVNTAGTEINLARTQITLQGNQTAPAAVSVIVYGSTTAPSSSLLQDNLATTADRAGRIIVFNALDRPVDLVDTRSEFNPDDNRVLLDNLAPGSAVELPPVAENTDLRPWWFTEAENNNAELFRLNNPEVYRVERDEAQLLVLSSERVADGTEQGFVRPVVSVIASAAISAYGGPKAVGELLFTRYMLPLQLVAILLLVAMIGAIVLTHKEGFQPRRRDIRRRVSKPLTAAISEQVGYDVLQTPAADVPQLPPQETDEPQPVGD